MSRIIFFFIVFYLLKGIDQVSAQLVSYEVYDEISIDEMNQILDDFGAGGIFLVENAVTIYKVHYTSPHPNGEIIPASGALAVPVGMECPKSLACYMHGTALDKEGVPSYGSDELKIGMILASSGYVVALPDYLGLGDSPGLHPYVHAKSEATAGIDMLRCARSISEMENFELNEQLFLFGYSQGGHAAMALHKEIQENYADEFTVTASAPMSGPYDISGAQTIYLTQDIPYSSPGYLPYVLFAYQSVYDYVPQDPSDFLIAPYDTLLPPLFYSGDQQFWYVNTVCNPVPKLMIRPDVYDDYISDPNHYFRAALEDNDVYKWVPEAPVRIYYCHGDDQVYYENSEIAYQYFIDNGAQDVQKFDYGNLDHGGCVSPALLNGKFYFDSMRDLSGGMVVGSSVTPNGSEFLLLVNPEGGVAPYSFSWANSTITTANFTAPSAGTYTVTVSDARGCSVQLDISAGAVGIQNPSINYIHLSPNPSFGDVMVQLADDNQTHRITVNNLSGQLALDVKGVKKNFMINKGLLPKGMYILKIDGLPMAEKLIIL